MPDNEIDVYLPRGSISFSDMVRISERKDGFVHFFREGGGQVHRAPEAEFDAGFRFVDGDELRRLSLRFEPVFVDGDWTGDEIKPLPAWSNGTLWNGWATPFFSKETILSDEGTASFRNPWNYVVHDEARDIFLLVTSNSEEMEIDGETDFSSVLARAAELADTNKGSFDMEFLGDTREIQIYRPRMLALEDGSEVVGYGIGSYSWTWNDVTDLVAAPEAAGPSA